MTDFLLELRCEEIPARMQLKASDDLARLFTEELAKAGLKPASIDSFVTPRRLALIARDLPLETAAVSEEFKGPRTSAPAQALEGFLRKTGLAQDQLEDRDGVWFAVVNKPGRATTDVLAEAVPAVIRAFPWPKSMRWGAASATTESLRWVRPLQGIIALLGGEMVPLSIEGIEAGRETVGHRFHSTGAIRIDGADDYADKLRAAHVIVSHQERQAIIEAKAGEAAAAKGYSVIEDKGLVAENAGLTEWPVPLLGDFDPEFLEVPPEVIQLTLRINQKYFVLRDAAGKLAPAFICTANIEAKDGGVAIVAGNRKVLAARLSDARFFWQQDRKTPLADQAKKLGRITFHEKLGTVADKVERVAKLAEWLASEGIVPNCDPALARQAAELCKADLVTEMVGEFPELQGVMGGYYARAEGLPDVVADAIRDHYKPVGQGDDVPTAPVTVAVSLADKLDTLVGFFGIEQGPTGSKDPFALRRAALSILRLLEQSNLRLNLKKVHAEALSDHVYRHVFLNTKALADVDAQTLAKFGFDPGKVTDVEWQAANLARPEIKSFVGAFAASDVPFLDFFADRLKVQQKEAGVRHDLIDAVFALGGEDDLVRLLARVKALQSFVATDDGANLLAGYKRAANILKKEAPDLTVTPAKAGVSGDGAPTPEMPASAGMTNLGLSYQPEKAEADLIAALDAAEPQAAQAVAAEEFEGAMAALATLRAPIDAFFETVTVNDADPAKRTTRLALLARVRDAVHNVADFSKITG
ncbi:glycine--tRNA ligase subunit beta [Sphingobium scionense]|uniref:Glycine--tRNA ligase beta subunit n=1 Tax=Sphingobium scionense TaxID=1404341 RepID=A0A7W6PVQ4_9SPHN|nr:glycine--tRNA ligase subunit beta [Sphingobium scionense]MBB4147120.1 glycyl-tRNA synthetase beta chain [Sphingobium scionense]